MKKHTLGFCILLAVTLATVFFIWCRSLQPADVSSGESGWFLALLQPVLDVLAPGTAEEQMHLVRKLAHFTEYAVLGGELMGLYRLWGVRVPHCLTGAAFFALLTAAVDETIQLGVQGRSGSPADVLLDFVGAAAGIAILFPVTCLCRKKH